MEGGGGEGTQRRSGSNGEVWLSLSEGRERVSDRIFFIHQISAAEAI